MAVAVASGWLVAAIPCRAITADRVLCSGPDGRSWAEANRCPPTPSQTETARMIVSKHDVRSQRDSCVGPSGSVASGRLIARTNGLRHDEQS